MGRAGDSLWFTLHSPLVSGHVLRAYGATMVESGGPVLQQWRKALEQVVYEDMRLTHAALFSRVRARPRRARIARTARGLLLTLV